MVGEVQKKNRCRASLGIHKTIIVPDFKYNIVILLLLLGEAEYFPPLTGHIS